MRAHRPRQTGKPGACLIIQKFCIVTVLSVSIKLLQLPICISITSPSCLPCSAPHSPWQPPSPSPQTLPAAPAASPAAPSLQPLPGGTAACHSDLSQFSGVSRHEDHISSCGMPISFCQDERQSKSSTYRHPTTKNQQAALPPTLLKQFHIPLFNA